MASVFVVTSGSYSDKTIEAIFDSEEKAQEYIKYCAKGGEYLNDIIEEIELNKYQTANLFQRNIDDFNSGYRTYIIGSCLKTGNIYNIKKEDKVLYEYEYDKVDKIRQCVKRINSNTCSMHYLATIKAKSEDQAIKIFSDLRRQALALENHGGNN